MQNLERATASQTKTPSFHYHLGNVYLGLGRPDDAEQAYLQSLEKDEFHPGAMLGLCRTYLDQLDFEKALQMGQAATGLKFQFPAAHFYLALAKMKNGDVDGAIESANTAIDQNPNFPEAHEFLARIYTNSKIDDKLAALHAGSAEDLRKDQDQLQASTERLRLPKVEKLDFFKWLPEISDLESKSNEEFTRCLAQPKSLKGSNEPEVGGQFPEVIIVSGLPRSGTSVMMQMLAAGGAVPFTDHVREPDENNPKGYLEADIVKKLPRKNDWLPEANGKVVKVVSPLIPYLPQGVKYKVVIMERNLDEIVDSQQMMLKRLDTTGGEIPPD